MTVTPTAAAQAAAPGRGTLDCRGRCDRRRVGGGGDGRCRRAGGGPRGVGASPSRGRRRAPVAVGETVILLHPPLPLVGVSIVMWRERQ